MSKRDGNNLSNWQIRERKAAFSSQTTSRKDGLWALQETCPYCKSEAAEPCMTRVTLNWATQCHADRLTLGRHARISAGGSTSAVRLRQNNALVKGITGSNVERKGEQIELDLSNPTPRMEISITNNLILTGPVCTLTEKELKHTVSIINRLQFKHPTLITEDDKEHIETLRSCAAILASLAILKEHLKPDSKDTYKLQRFNFIEGTTT